MSGFLKLSISPTAEIFGSLETAFDFFNERLFSQRLPPCAFNMERRRNVYGHFHGGRFVRRDGSETADEISINPQFLRTRPVLQTIGHEMVHCEQFHFGHPSRNGYHNRQFAEWMCRIDLIPGDTGKPGGKQTGQRMADYIKPGGRFERVCEELLATGWSLDWGARTIIAMKVSRPQVISGRIAARSVAINSMAKESQADLRQVLGPVPITLRVPKLARSRASSPTERK
jgi:hypothetical protein